MIYVAVAGIIYALLQPPDKLEMYSKDIVN